MSKLFGEINVQFGVDKATNRIGVNTKVKAEDGVTIEEILRVYVALGDSIHNNIVLENLYSSAEKADSEVEYMREELREYFDSENENPEAYYEALKRERQENE